MGKVIDTFLGTMELMFRALFNEVFVPAMSEVMSLLFTVLFTPVKMYFAYGAYTILIMLCGIIDSLENILNLFIGTVPVSKTDGRTLMEVIFQMKTVNNAFLYITVAAVCICFVLTIVAVAKSMSSMTLGNRNPITYVLKSTAKACMAFIMVPLMCLFMLSMSNIVVSQAQTAMTAHLGVDRVPSTGEYIFLTASIRAGKKVIWSDLLSDTMGTLEGYKTALIDDNIASLGAISDEITDAIDELTAISNGTAEQGFLEDDFRLGNLTMALNKIDTTTASEDILKTKKLIEDTVDAIRQESLNIIDSTYPYLKPSMSDPLRQSYLSGEKDYKNMMHSGVDFSVFKIDYLVGFLAAGFIALVFMGLTIQFIRRMLELVVLYLTAPFFAAAIPLDDGEMFKKWRESFIAKFLSGFSVLFALKLYLLLLPLIFSDNLDLGTKIIGDMPNIGSTIIEGIEQGSGAMTDHIVDQIAGGAGTGNTGELIEEANALDEAIKEATKYAEEMGVGDNNLYETLLRSSGLKDRNSPTDAAAFVNSVLRLIFLIGGTWAVYKSQVMVMEILHPETSENTRQTTLLAFAAAKKIVSTGADVAKKGVKIGGTVVVGAVTGGVGGVAAAGAEGAGMAAKGAAAAAKAAGSAIKTAGSAAKSAAGEAKNAVSKGSDDS